MLISQSRAYLKERQRWRQSPSSDSLVPSPHLVRGRGLSTRLVKRLSYKRVSETREQTLHSGLSLVPRPRPAFRRLQYGKAWRAWYLFSREHDVIGKWRKVSEQTGCVSRISQLTTRSTLGVYDNRPPIARYVR